MIRVIAKFLCIIFILFINFGCGSDSGGGTDDEIIIDSYSLIVEEESIASEGINFGYIKPGSVSESKSFTVKGENLTSEIQISISDNFQLSLDNLDYNSSVTVASANSNFTNTIYVRFTPGDTAIGDINGVVNINNADATNISFDVEGKTGNMDVINYVTFDKERLAFGGGYTQHLRKTFTLHNDINNIESIKMYVKLTCPDVGCDEWDVFANVKVKDPISGEDYELGRYITPYWNDNSQLIRGFEFDVTDFKSILTGDVELRIRTECWNARGYEVTVDFDYHVGIPDYPYYAISRVFNYDNGSASGVPYGISHDMDLTRDVTIPLNAESTHLRTFINGWGEAYPADSDGRRCAEWCYRTHHIKINNINSFEHYMGPLDCASNPVNNQSPGNWMPDRAGWCPGMVVPTRIDKFATPMAGETFGLEYSFEDWVSDETKDAYYPLSTFIVVKSNTEIARATVVD
ncbi:peptide-N-glycosidase F-related protein [Seonamhaeicola sp. MEBiC1930]|uniref:peptide-N-glycosidase F-related protein n=1 Tax=Seonamhaeicola sp. MEBiC01930 TaxID=2976768 RepID=UPI00324A5F7F